MSDFNLSNERLGYGKILKKMDTGEYNFFGKELEDVAEGFVYPEEKVKELLDRIKATMLLTPSPIERGEFIKWLGREINNLAGEQLTQKKSTATGEGK